MDKSIRFPHLGIYLSNVGKSIHIGGFEIAYYGIVIACAMVLGLCLAMWVAKKTKQDPDLYFDVALYAIPIALVGARLYYVIFSWDQYKDNLIHILYIREGGLAIYGGVIAAVITFYVYVKIKKENFWLMVDTGCVGLVLGQIIGRWGNFFNREVFGGYTDSLFAMQLPLNAVRASDVTQEMMDHLQTIDGVSYIQVHPTFLYESLWNVGVLLILLFFTKRKKFDGEIFLMYLAGYGIGRFWIEGVRTDQLLIPGIGLPVSQVLSAILAVGAVLLIFIRRKKALTVNRTSE
ncbi:MAG: prolipoprotein diacylglyceryl transferase [Firmicutes bacterium]|nr:prolipoprotein diacylglyceryl transferase [Lachnospiraceae bacterium]MDD6065205.1 prolipoprotein diacylglyceryl transferase [Bacillota bacterium]MDY2819354.1 prolipoprotein diacylglyceryl transferase [Hominisplanchenecus sp.]